MGSKFVRTKRVEAIIHLSVCVCVGRYTHSNRGPIKKEDNRVSQLGKGPSWKVCINPPGAVARNLQQKYKQKRNNRRSLIAGVDTLVRVAVQSLSRR